MRFEPLEIEGAWLLMQERIEDERGWFARTYCVDEFLEHGLDPTIAQCNASFNADRLTLRGMHLQHPPSAEAKVISCTRGQIYDVLVDLRDDSPTRHRWTARTLTEGDGRALYAPKGIAHGFLTLTEASEVYYQLSARYDPTRLGGMRYDDPVIGIEWPEQPLVVSERDLSFPPVEP